MITLLNLVIIFLLLLLLLLMLQEIQWFYSASWRRGLWLIRRLFGLIVSFETGLPSAAIFLLLSTFFTIIVIMILLDDFFNHIFSLLSDTAAWCSWISGAIIIFIRCLLTTGSKSLLDVWVNRSFLIFRIAIFIYGTLEMLRILFMFCLSIHNAASLFIISDLQLLFLFYHFKGSRLSCSWFVLD